jgi:hypothetical protein
MNKDEALKLALQALKTIDEAMPFPVAKLAQKAIKEALAQPEPWEKFCDSNCVWTDHHPDCKLAQRPWIGLTDEEISELIRATHNTGSFVRAIEAKLEAKNTSFS